MKQTPQDTTSLVKMINFRKLRGDAYTGISKEIKELLSVAELSADSKVDQFIS